MKGLSTLTEILTRGEIYSISRSERKPERYIIIFKMGDQANIDQEVYNQLIIA